MSEEENLYYPIGHMMPADNDHLEPPPGFLNRNLAEEDLDANIIFLEEGLPTVVTFGGSGLDPATGRAQYSMQNFLQNSAINQIHLRDQYTCWFHNGVQGASTDVATTVQYLQGVLRGMKSDRVLCTGASAGGYAAILFGTLLSATGVIALCPQTLLQRGLKCQAHGYLYLLKWADGNGFWEPTKQQYRDLLDLPSSDTRVEIVYGEHDFVDVFHAERMSVLPNVRLEKVPGNHGTAIYRARDNGILAQLFSDVLAVDIWSRDSV